MMGSSKIEREEIYSNSVHHIDPSVLADKMSFKRSSLPMKSVI